MSSRVGGALALGAALLVAIALISSSWWAGHPKLDGHEIEYKTATLGFRGGELCNTGGDGKCRDIPVSGGFKTAGIIATVLGVFALLGLIAIGIAGIRGAARSKEIARVALAPVGAAAIAALAFTFTRPSAADLPIGYGMIVFWLGTLIGVASGVLAIRPPRARAPKPVPAFAPTTNVAGAGVDVLALFGDELRSTGDSALPPPPAFGQAPAFMPPAYIPPPQYVPPGQPYEPGFDPYASQPTHQQQMPPPQMPPPQMPPPMQSMPPAFAPPMPAGIPPTPPPLPSQFPTPAPGIAAANLFGSSGLRPLYDAAPSVGGTGGLDGAARATATADGDRAADDTRRRDRDPVAADRRATDAGHAREAAEPRAADSPGARSVRRRRSRRRRHHRRRWDRRRRRASRSRRRSCRPPPSVRARPISRRPRRASARRSTRPSTPTRARSHSPKTRRRT